MSYVVTKEFKTVNRIMKIGTPVAPGDHLEPHGFEILKARGFVGPLAERGSESGQVLATAPAPPTPAPPQPSNAKV